MNSKRGLLVFNPKSGRHQGKKIASKYLNFFAHSVDFLEIAGSSAEETSQLIAANIEKVDFVIAIGGDGLVNLVLQHSAPLKKPIYVHPAGTGNDFHRHHFPKNTNLISLKNSLENFHVVERDLVVTKIRGRNRFYGQILSAGFDSLVNARANKMKYLPGTLKYVISLLLEITSFKPINYRIKVDGVAKEFTAMLLVVANGPTYGGGMKVVPMATSNDGILDVLILHPVTKFELLRVFPKVYLGKHITHPRVELIKCKALEVDSNVPIYADGERFGVGNFQVEIAPSFLPILEIK